MIAAPFAVHALSCCREGHREESPVESDSDEIGGHASFPVHISATEPRIRSVDPVPVPSDHIQLFAQTGDSPVRWRLLSGNNREIGRGLVLFTDEEECRLAIKELQCDLGQLVSRIRPTPPNQWAWELRRADQPVAASGHAFDRLVRCERGLAQFIERMAEAPIASTVMVSEARRWMR